MRYKVAIWRQIHDLIYDCVTQKWCNNMIYFMVLWYCQKQPWEVYYIKTVLKNFGIFTGKHLCWGLFLIKEGLKACNFIKKRLQHRYFPVDIAKFLRKPILKNICCFCVSFFFYAYINTFTIDVTLKIKNN